MIFPPGRAKAGYEPISYWIGTAGGYDGDCRGRLHSSSIRRADGNDDVHFETDQFGCKVRQPIESPFCISVLNDNVFSFDYPSSRSR